MLLMRNHPVRYRQIVFLCITHRLTLQNFLQMREKNWGQPCGLPYAAASVYTQVQSRPTHKPQICEMTFHAVNVMFSSKSVKYKGSNFWNHLPNDLKLKLITYFNSFQK